MAIFPFGYPILFWCIYTRGFVNHTLFLEVGCYNLVEVIPCIIIPKIFNFDPKLVLNHGVKGRDNTTHIRILFHQKYPCNSSTIINQENKPSRPGNIRNRRRSPNITMNPFKWIGTSFVTNRKGYTSVLRKFTNITIKIRDIQALEQRGIHCI